MGLYKKRQYKSHGLTNFDGISMKIYSIAAEGREDIDMRPVLEYAAPALAKSPIPWMSHRGLGYLIYHAGEDANWLLTRVWLKGDIVSGLTAAGYGDRFEGLSVPLVECVWESVVGHFERDAWIKHMMAEREDAKGYLNDFLKEGLH